MMEEILAMAQKLGRVSDGDLEALEALCQAAEAEVGGRLREGLTPEACGPAYVLGCAWLALAGLAGNEAGRSPLRFTAGEVSVQEEGGDAPQRAQALRMQAEAVLAPYLKDRGFVFQGVEG